MIQLSCNMIVAKCSCPAQAGSEAEAEEKKYGKSMRIHNPGEKYTDDTRKYRCVVCGKEKRL